MTKYQKEDRVVDSYLGAGTVVKKLRGIDAYLVLFDKTPDVRYNMGENPCLVFGESLEEMPNGRPKK